MSSFASTANLPVERILETPYSRLHRTKRALRIAPQETTFMRSEYVFAAAKEISNRFLLCRVTSVSARRLHIASTQPSETINQSLKLIATGDGVGLVEALPAEQAAAAGES